MQNRLDIIKTIYNLKSDTELAMLLGVHRNTIVNYRSGARTLPDDMESVAGSQALKMGIAAGGQPPLPEPLDNMLSATALQHPGASPLFGGLMQQNVSTARYRIGDCSDLTGNMITRQQVKLLKAESLWWEHEWIDEHNGHQMFNLYRRSRAGTSHCSAIRMDAATWVARVDFGPAEATLLEYLNGMVAARRESLRQNPAQLGGQGEASAGAAATHA